MEMYFTLRHTCPEPGTIVGKAKSLAGVIMRVEGLIQENKALDGLTLDIEDSKGNVLYSYERGSRLYLWH